MLYSLQKEQLNSTTPLTSLRCVSTRWKFRHKMPHLTATFPKLLQTVQRVHVPHVLPPAPPDAKISVLLISPPETV